MEYRINKLNNDRISLLGFGCMRFPVINGNTECIDMQLTQEMITYAYENGVNYFDTAYPYHGGKSEAAIASMLSAYARSSYYLADKLPVWKVESYTDLNVILQEQLTRCNTDYFDYYLCHAVDKTRFSTIKEHDIYSFLHKKREDGVLRRIGFSFHDEPSVLRKICSEYKWDFVQLQINYLDWEYGSAKELYEIAQEYNLQVIIMEPVRGGALASLAKSANDLLITQCPEKSIASWAIRFAATLPNVLTVLSGMSDMVQVKDNVNSFMPFEPLSFTQEELLISALAEHRKAKTIGCTACSYCMPCPFGVDIPQIFKKYNEAAIFGSDALFSNSLKAMPKNEQPQNCTSCGACKKLCPQKIDISKHMQSFI